jgi:outer membrane cobalamin receptor
MIFIFSFKGWPEEAPTFFSDEVVVTASRILQLRTELPASITVITSTEIKTLGAKNVGDILNYSFGTLSRTTGYVGSQISGGIRGASYQQMFILIDGQRINSPLLGGYDLGDLSVDNIEKVEIVRGPASALYGADAVGGVVNIITNKAENKYSLSVLYKSAEKGANDLELMTSGGSDLFDYSFSAGQGYSPGYRENSDYTSQKFNGSILKNLDERSKLGVSFDLYYAKKGVPGALSFLTPSTRQEDNDQHFRIISETKVTDQWNIKLNSTFGKMQQRFSSDPASSPYDIYGADSDQFELQNDIKLGDSDLFNIGAELRNDESRSSLSGDHLVTNKAVYIQDQHYFTPDLSLLVSSRYDNHSIYGDTSNPRFGLNYKFNKDSSFWVSYGEAYRAPTLNDLYTYYVDPVWGTIMKGNPRLKPESSKSSEIGLRSKLTDNIEVNANYFTSKVDNLITWVDISGTWMTWEAQNVNSADISGYEAGITCYLSSALKCFVNYTATDATDGKTGKDLPYKPRTQYNAGLEYNDEDDNSAGILFHHVGERYDNQANTRKVDAYTVTSINFNRRLSPQMIFIAGAENFLNEDYQDTYDYPMPGRIYTFGVRYDLI